MIPLISCAHNLVHIMWSVPRKFVEIVRISDSIMQIMILNVWIAAIQINLSKDHTAKVSVIQLSTQHFPTDRYIASIHAQCFGG